MKQFIGTSARGDLSEALRGLNNPSLIILMSNSAQFEEHVAQLEEAFPGIPSIGVIAMGYSKSVMENGVQVVAFSDGIKACANVLEEVSKMPVKYVKRLMTDVDSIGGTAKDTVVINLCAGNDACVLTTMYSVLGKKGISLTGGTGNDNKVSANGKIYEDASAYAVVKNSGRRVKVYKENIYKPIPGVRFIASETDREKYIVGKLDGQSSKQFYMNALKLTSDKDLAMQTLQNPFGKMQGQDICIISLKEIVGNQIMCYRQINDSDVITLLETNDYRGIVDSTINQIKSDFSQISAVFSVNCIFRYVFFSNENYMGEYLDSMQRLGSHAGLIGNGEHFNNQFINQSMSCVVFE